MYEELMTLASRPKRFFGSVLDAVAAMVICVFVIWLLGVSKKGFSITDMSIVDTIMVYAIGWGVMLALNGYLLYTRGQTIGKVAMKTKIVDMGGNIPSFGKLLALRYLIPSLVAQIPYIGVLISLINVLAIFGQDHRCLHDYLAGTQVVDAE